MEYMEYLAPSLCIIGAVVLACIGVSGWGWLLFASWLVSK